MEEGKRSSERCLFLHWLVDRLRSLLSKSPRTNRKGPLERIGGAPHTATAGAVENMRVNHGRFQILVAQKILNRSNIIPVPYQVRREGMAEGMAGGRAAYLGVPDGLLDGSLDDRLVQVMAPFDFRTRVTAEAICRESPLPAPFPAGRRILPLESIRHVDAGNPFRQVLLVELLHPREPGCERRRGIVVYLFLIVLLRLTGKR
jgi:hypothetical protein